MGFRAATALSLCVSLTAAADARAGLLASVDDSAAAGQEGQDGRDGREAQLARARDAAGDRPAEARLLYEQLLRRDPADDEARTGLARLDLWAGRPREAETTLREVLSRHPLDTEVRASLVDALLRQERYREAAAEAEAGLSGSPGDPQLLLRRARMARGRGDEDAARTDALAAERAAPGDGEVRALLDSIRRGEAQELVREEIHAGADDIHVADLSVVQAVGRAWVGFRTEQSQRYASVSPGHGYNALYAVSVGALLGRGFSGNLELGLGTPALAVPRRLLRVGAEGPIAGPATFAASYTLWSFTAVTAHIVQPVLSWELTERLRLDLRYAFTDVILTDGTGSRRAHSGGAGLAFAALPRLTLSGGYFHGVQLDRGANIGELVDVRSDFLTAAADVRFSRTLGVRPLYTLELRTRPATETIHSLQLALYQRW